MGPSKVGILAIPERGAAITIPALTPVGLTLKATAPEALTPATDSIIRDLTAQLVVSSPTGKWVDAALQVTFELWKISGGTTTMVFAQTVSAGAGTTSATTSPLENNQEYAWRAFASLQGATGPSSTPFAFRTEFMLIEPPTLVAPIGGETATGSRPLLLVDNGRVVNVPGPIVYQFDVDTSPSFDSPIRTLAVRTGDTGDRTTGMLETSLSLLTTYYWRVRGTNGIMASDWSATETFVTPDTLDEIDPSQIVWLHTDVSGWAVNSTITGITVNESTVCVFHTQAGQWPFSTDVFPVEEGDPPGGAPIEGNIWIMAQFNGIWHAATWDWLRPGQQCKSEGADAFGRDQIRISPMDASWVPQLGDPIGFMMSTIARTSERAGMFRTNIVVVRPWPY